MVGNATMVVSIPFNDQRNFISTNLYPICKDNHYTKPVRRLYPIRPISFLSGISDEHLLILKNPLPPIEIKRHVLLLIVVTVTFESQEINCTC